MEAVTTIPGGGFDVSGSRTSRPVIGHVDDGLEAPLAEMSRDGWSITPVGPQVAHGRSKIVMIAPVQHRHLMAAGDQSVDDAAAHELRAADNECAHAHASPNPDLYSRLR